MNKRIIFIHSLNNFSGSPNVLSILIKAFISKGYSVDLITSKGQGFLSNIRGINYNFTIYKWSNNKLLTFYYLILSQVQIFFLILSKYRKEKGIFYLNTIIPFGAAWACKILKKNLVYHIHEDMNLHKPLYPIYRYTYYICCQKSIFVSNYLERSSKSKKKSIVVHNALSNEFISLAKENLILKNFIRSNILMVSSLKKAKGIYEFIEISRRLPQYGFELVVNATNQEVETFKTETNLPGNLKIYTQQTDLHSFYQRAKLLFNLSHPDKLIETFGLTILEAMVYGIPSIVPPVGGPTELIIDGFNGFTIDPFNINKLIEKTNILMNNDVMYSRFSDNAQKKSNDFVFEKMINNIENFLLEEYLAK